MNGWLALVSVYLAGERDAEQSASVRGHEGLLRGETEGQSMNSGGVV